MTAPSVHALVVGAAPTPDFAAEYAAIIREAEFVIAADAGAALCRAADRVCDLCVGDMDSIDGITRAWLDAHEVPLRFFPAEKDASDLDLASDAARELGAATLDLTAAFHGRIDHTIAALGTLLRAADLSARALDPTFTAYALEPGARFVLELAEAPGTSISLFTFDTSTLVSIAGVRYPLDRAQLPRLTSLGLSNVALEPRQRVEVHSGRVLCVVPHREFLPNGLLLTPS